MKPLSKLLRKKNNISPFYGTHRPQVCIFLHITPLMCAMLRPVYAHIPIG